MKQIIEDGSEIIYKILNTYVMENTYYETKYIITEDDVICKLLSLNYTGEQIENILCENSEKNFDDLVKKQSDENFDENNEDFIYRILTEGQFLYIDIIYDRGFKYITRTVESTSLTQIPIYYLKEDDNIYFVIKDNHEIEHESFDGFIYRDLLSLLHSIKDIIGEKLNIEMYNFVDDYEKLYKFHESFKDIIEHRI